MRTRSIVVRVVGLMLAVTLLTGAKHEVRPGETYASVAQAFAVEEVALRRANPDIDELVPKQVITVPASPSKQVWSAAHPYAPPTPTVSDLNQQIASGAIVLTENPKHKGYYFMWAGPEHDIEIGQAHPVERKVRGKVRVPDLNLRPVLGRLRPRSVPVIKPRSVYAFYVYPETGGREAVGVGITTSFQKPEKIEPCTCIPLGL